MLKNLIALFIPGLISLTANATQLVHLQVDQRADAYNIYVEMDFDAPAESVRKILTDYGNLNRLNESIISSQIIDTENNGKVRVHTRFESCVLFFCMELEKVEDITEDRNGRIIVNMIPDSSNFRSGQASWEVQSTRNGSRVIHYAQLEPDIWLPSWIGASIVKDTLRQEIQKSFENLECLARADCQQPPEVTQEHEKDWDWDDETWES